MNVAYNEINCADAAKMIGVDYSTVAKWCKAGRINCVNVSEGTEFGRYIIKEDEVRYIKTLKDKFGNQFIRKYRKDWSKGKQKIEKEIVKEEPVKVRSTVMDISTDEPIIIKKRVDIDEIAIKFGCLQDLKDELESLDARKTQVTAKIEELRKELMQYL